MSISAAALGVFSLTHAFAQPHAAENSDPELRVRLVLDVGTDGAACISRDELEQAAQAQLGRAVFAQENASVAGLIRVRIERTPDGFRASVSAEREAAEKEPGVPATGVPAVEERQLEARGDCRALDEQLALVVALLADSETTRPSKSEAPFELAPPPAPETLEPEETPGPVSVAPAWEAAQRKPWGFGFDAAVASGFGVLPQTALGAEVGAGVTPPGWPFLRLRALVFLPVSSEVEPGAEVDFLSVLAGAGVCPDLVAWGRAGLHACFGGDATLLRAASSGLDGSRVAKEWRAQLSIALRGSYSMTGNWLVTLGVEAGLVSSPKRFTYEKDGETRSIFEPALVPVFLSLGLAGRHP